MTLLRGRLVPGRDPQDEWLDDAVVELVAGRVVDVRPARAGDPPPVGTLLPGLVDGHCHGGGGASFATTDRDEVMVAARFHLMDGTTTVVASLVTEPVEVMLQRCALLAQVCGGSAPGSAAPVAGIHLEGPFLSPRRRGAHPAHLLLGSDVTVLDRLLEAGDGHVRHVTLAPELPGYDQLADRVRAAGAVVALGHSDADDATATAAFGRGAGAATHLFNGMRPWEHRGSSVVSAALAAAARGQAVVELIADGTHVDAGTVAAVMALLPGRTALVSDAAPPAGLPDGEAVLGAVGLRVVGGVVRTRDGSLAGGSGSLLDVLRFTVQQAGVPLARAVAAATRVPAALLGLDRTHGVGRLDPGSRADVLVVDDDLRPLQVWQAGVQVR